MNVNERRGPFSRILAHGLVGGIILFILVFKVPPLRARLAANDVMILDLSNKINAQEMLRTPYAAMSEDLRILTPRIQAEISSSPAPPLQEMTKWISEAARQSDFHLELERTQMDAGSSFASSTAERLVSVIRGRGNIPSLVAFLERLCAPSFSRGIDQLDIMPASADEVSVSLRLVTKPATRPSSPAKG